MTALSRDGHDYLWARLPFLVPMAVKMSRQCCGPGPDCGRLAGLVGELSSMVLSHLEHEEKTLASLNADRDDERIAACLADLRAQHQQVLRLLGEVCEVAGLPREPVEDVCPTVRAFHEELDRIGRHLRAQLALEDGRSFT